MGNTDQDKYYKEPEKVNIDDLPIGILAFAKQKGKIEVLALNGRLLEFANSIHSAVETTKDELWNYKKLSEEFSNNIFAFASEEDVDKVASMIEDAHKNGCAQTIFHLKDTYGDNTKWILSMCSCKHINQEKDAYYTLFMDFTKAIVYESELLEKQEELIAKQKELESLIRFDTLTDVANRWSYNTYIKNKENCKLRETGIIYADINGIKAANDEFGHQFGDAIINEFSVVLREFFDKQNIFRINGDAFVVIVEDISKENFEKKVNELLHIIEYNNMAAIGYKWQSEITDLNQMLYMTERLMTIQKQKYYFESESKKSKHRPQILQTLISDMDNGRFTVFLQPKAVLGSTIVIGAEALIRKIDENGNIIPPYQFVPILEKELLISKIYFFVLEEVCKMLHRWKLENRRLIKISVNMSRVTMAENDFLNHVISICNQYEINKNQIELEITESTDTKDSLKMTEMVATLSHLGFGISLDDMGNDYSSIKMVTMKGIDVVKIDRSLVLQMENKEGVALIRHIIALCHEIGKKCIAEGVETQEQAKLLLELSCDYYQGFLLDRPIPVNQFEKYL